MFGSKHFRPAMTSNGIVLKKKKDDLSHKNVLIERFKKVKK